MEQTKMGFGKKLAYGMGDFGSNFCWTFISSFILIYLTDTVGMSAGLVGTLLMVSKFMDGFTDIIMGGLIDRTHSKMGKARPWLLWSAFPLVLLLVLLFSVPAGFSATGKAAYVLIMYTLLGAVCYTASNISYNSLVSLATNNPRDRVSMGSIRFIFAVLAGLVIMSITANLVQVMGGGQRGWTTVAIVYGIIFLVFTLITVFGVKELPQPEQTETQTAEGKPAKTSFIQSLALLAKNKYFLIMLGIYLATYVYSGISGTIGIYYVTYVLGNPSLLGVMSLAGTLPIILMLPFTPKLTEKLGMQRTCLLGYIVCVAGSLLLVFSNNSVPVIMVATFIRTIGSTPLIGSMYAIVAEIAEYAYLKFNTRMDGVIYSCSSVGIKVGSGVGTALVGWLLSWAGYNGLAQVQSQSALNAIQGLYLVAPLVIAVVVGALLFFQRVEKANAALRGSTTEPVASPQTIAEKG